MKRILTILSCVLFTLILYFAITLNRHNHPNISSVNALKTWSGYKTAGLALERWKDGRCDACQ